MRCKTIAVATITILSCFTQLQAQGFLDRLENVLDAEAKATDSEGRWRLGYLGLVAEEELGGLRVATVREATPAADAGIRPGDWIRQIGDRKVTTLDEMGDAMAGLLAGQKVDLIVRRDDKNFRVPVKLGERPQAAERDGVVDEVAPRPIAPPDPKPAADPGADAIDALGELEKILDAAPPAPKDGGAARERRIAQLEQQLQAMKRHIAELERELADISAEE